MPNQSVKESSASRLISAYNRLDTWLKNQLGLGDETSLSKLLDLMMSQNFLLSKNAKYLKDMGKLRNAIVHKYDDKKKEERIIAEPLESEVECFEKIVESITAPQPLSEICTKDLKLWSFGCPLTEALTEMGKHDFSQILVELENCEYGFITREGVSRWLEHCIQHGRVEIENAVISDILSFEEKDSCIFVSEQISFFEALDKFNSLSQRIQLLVTTESGTAKDKPTGIATSFDIARKVAELPLARKLV
ncbi:MAG: hypothetical protein WBI82_06615 [Sphaerochaeta sp.]